MTKIKEEVEKYLELEPLFRERKNKDRGIVNLLMRRYPQLAEMINMDIISKDALTAIVQDYASMDRRWRQTLEYREDLRGKDYDEKDKLEENKLVELGYHAPTRVSKEPASVQPTLL